MFKYCVWYLIDSPSFSNCIKKNAQLFSTPVFKPHITIRSQIENLDTAKHVAENYSMCPTPVFRAHGVPTKKHVRAHRIRHIAYEDIDFYSIQQRVSVNGRVFPGVHMALAYSLSPFTDMDVAVATSNVLWPTLEATVCVAKCFSENPAEWQVVHRTDHT